MQHPQPLSIATPSTRAHPTPDAVLTFRMPKLCCHTTCSRQRTNTAIIYLSISWHNLYSTVCTEHSFTSEFYRVVVEQVSPNTGDTYIDLPQSYNQSYSTARLLRHEQIYHFSSTNPITNSSSTLDHFLHHFEGWKLKCTKSHCTKKQIETFRIHICDLLFPVFLLHILRSSKWWL